MKGTEEERIGRERRQGGGSNVWVGEEQGGDKGDKGKSKAWGIKGGQGKRGE